MERLFDIKDFDASAGSVVAVGVFDGLHLGHANIIETLRTEAARLGVRSCVLTFRTHPRKVVSGERLALVTSFEHRLLLLERAGVDAVVGVDFTTEFADQSAKDFVERVLAKGLGARVLIIGHNARFGVGREADAEGIRQIASAAGIQATIVEPIIVEGEPVSSTRVRTSIQNGDLAEAERLLGRRVSVLGRVVRGRGIGRTLGFPTANLDVHHEVRPPHGVYATWATFEGTGGKPLASVTNVGFRPTFVEDGEPAGEPERRIEIHLLDAPPEDLYGRVIEAEFVKHLRDERPFATNAELAAQIARDVEAARTILAEGISS
jgi:riboflavin kinase/FMN adenylyltransferase